MRAHRIDCVCAECGKAYEKRADRVMSPDYCSAGCRKMATDRAIALDIKSRTRNCAGCGKEFSPRKWQLDVGIGRFCSTKCGRIPFVNSGHGKEARAKSVATWRRNGNTVPSGPENACFKPRKFSDGYAWVWDAKRKRHMQEHRLSMESLIGRRLHSYEIVHHKNGNKLDNRVENLEIHSRASHMKEHILEVTTARQKVKVSKGKKLSIETVSRLKSRLREGVSNIVVAQEFGITTTMVSYIKSGKSWGHAP